MCLYIELLVRIQLMAPTSGTTQQEEGLRKRKGEEQQQQQQQKSKNVTPNYTTEQAEAVKRIKKCKDYYEILMVSKDATDTEIKKQYKKLALQLHPDKNHCPGAAEAFKAIGTLITFFRNLYLVGEKEIRYFYVNCKTLFNMVRIF